MRQNGLSKRESGLIAASAAFGIGVLAFVAACASAADPPNAKSYVRQRMDAVAAAPPRAAARSGGFIPGTDSIDVAPGAGARDAARYAESTAPPVRFAAEPSPPPATLPTTRPGTVKYVGVFAQPVVDKNGVRLLEKWYAAGARLFVGWASSAQTSGVDRIKDRAEQLAWRAAVRNLGPDARYVDYVLPDWRWPATAADAQLMMNDPACAGFFYPDEPNIKDNGRDFRFPIEWFRAYAAAIEAVDPGRTKFRVIDFAGNGLTAAWGSYKAADVVPYAELANRVATSWHPRNAYGDTRPDCDIYPGRAVQVLARVAPDTPRWYISECANEGLNKIGRAPTHAELVNQITGVLAQDNARAPIEALIWFPQRPVASAAHVFDNTTPAQFESVRAINDFVLRAPPAPSTLPTTQPAADPRVDQLIADVAAVRAEAEAARNERAADAARNAEIGEALRRAAELFAPRPPPPTTVPTTAPATQPAAKPVFNANPKDDDPPAARALRPISWLHPAYYGDTPTPRPAGDAGVYAIPRENLAAIARLCRDGGTFKGGRFEPGALVVFDWEGHYDPPNAPQPRKDLTRAAAYALFASYIRTFRAEAPGLKIGVYGVVGDGLPPRAEEWVDGIDAAELARARIESTAQQVLIDECDFIVPSYYLNGAPWVERDVAAFAEMSRLTRKLYPGKPLYPFVFPKWDGRWGDAPYADAVKLPPRWEIVPPDAMRRYVAAVLAASDGIALWVDEWGFRTLGPPFLDALPAVAR